MPEADVVRDHPSDTDDDSDMSFANDSVHDVDVDVDVEADEDVDAEAQVDSSVERDADPRAGNGNDIDDSTSAEPVPEHGDEPEEEPTKRRSSRTIATQTSEKVYAIKEEPTVEQEYTSHAPVRVRRQPIRATRRRSTDFLDTPEDGTRAPTRQSGRLASMRRAMDKDARRSGVPVNSARAERTSARSSPFPTANGRMPSARAAKAAKPARASAVRGTRTSRLTSAANVKQPLELDDPQRDDEELLKPSSTESSSRSDEYAQTNTLPGIAPASVKFVPTQGVHPDENELEDQREMDPALSDGGRNDLLDCAVAGSFANGATQAASNDNEQQSDATVRDSPPEPGSDKDNTLSLKQEEVLAISGPVAVGDHVACAISAERSGGLIEASVVAVSPEPPSEPTKVYVHFMNRDRRLDRWVPVGELRQVPKATVDNSRQASLDGDAISGRKGDIRGAPASRSSRSGRAGDSDTSRLQGRSRDTPSNRADLTKVTRSRRRALEEFNPVSEKEVGDEFVAQMEEAREEHTKVRNVSAIVFGEYEVDVWYFSPYPGVDNHADRLFVCGFCLKYMLSARRYEAHCKKCQWKFPPGVRIYEDSANDVSVYEIDGMVNVAYCQRLCLLGKLFLDHKTLYFDVAPFLFYVVCSGGEVAGFFSKEKPLVVSEFNLACIVTLPQHQRKGIGRFLIALSYELTRREGKTGSPERPLSDLGQLSYRSYWMYAIISYVRSKRGAVGISAKDVAAATGIRLSDVAATLKSMGVLSIWKGETYVDTNPKALEHAQRRIRPPRLPLHGNLLEWSTLKKPEVHSASASPRLQGSSTPSGRPRKRSRKGQASGSGSTSATSTRALAGEGASRAAAGSRTEPSSRVSSTPSRARGRSSPRAPRSSTKKRTPPDKSRNIDFEDVRLNVSEHQVEDIEQCRRFVLQHTARKVLAPIDSPTGLSEAEIRTFTKGLRTSHEGTLVLLARTARAALADPDVLVVPGISRLLARALASADQSTPDSSGQKSSGAGSSDKQRTATAAPDSSAVHEPADRKAGDSQEVVQLVVHSPGSLTEAADGGITPAASPNVHADVPQADNTEAAAVHGTAYPPALSLVEKAAESTVKVPVDILSRSVSEGAHPVQPKSSDVAEPSVEVTNSLASIVPAPVSAKETSE